MQGLQARVQVLWIFEILSMMTGLASGIVDIAEYFALPMSDRTTVTWSHATNTQAALAEALDSDIMMIEADVVMGRKDGSTQRMPIMAHPPKIVTDLSLDDFLMGVIHANKTKGIKLDFKEIEAAEIGLKILGRLEDEDSLPFPVWINADILRGPVNSTKLPVDSKRFLELAHEHLPTATLSIGWVTRYGRDDIKADPSDQRLRTIQKGSYSYENVKEMLDLVDGLSDDLDAHITFPMRAGLAARSEGEILHLLNGASFVRRASITIWSDKNDPVDMTKLRQLFNTIGQSRIFLDLPFDLRTGPEIIPDVNLDNLVSTSWTLALSLGCVYLAVLVRLFL